MSSISVSTRPMPGSHVVSAARLSVLERLALAIGIIEIPLQLDKYLMFHAADSDLGAVGGFNVSITSLCLVFLYGVWIAEGALRRSPRSGRVIVGWPILWYLAAVALSTASATLPMLSLFDLFLGLQAFALFYYIANRIDCRDDLVFCLLVLATTMLIQSVFIFGMSIFMSAGDERIIGPLNLTVWEDGRPAGSMQSAVLAGSVLAIIWLPVASLALGCRGIWVWSVATICTAAGLLAILLTQTRGAILTTVVGVTIISGGLLIRGRLPRWAIGAGVLLAVLSIVPLSRVIENRIQGDDGGSASARKHLTAIALEMIADRPLLGYGAGNCHLAGQRYADQGKYRAEWYYTIHCKYLLVWIECGLLGLVGFLAMLGSGIRHGLCAWRSDDPLLAPLGIAFSAAIAGHMLHMLVDVFNSRTQVQILWVVLGMAALTCKLASAPRHDSGGGAS